MKLRNFRKYGLVLSAAILMGACGDSGSEERSFFAEEERGELIDFDELPDGEYVLKSSTVKGTSSEEYSFVTRLAVDADQNKVISNECQPNEAVTNALGRIYRYLGFQMSSSASVPRILQMRNGEPVGTRSNNVKVSSISYMTEPTICTTTITEDGSAAFAVEGFFSSELSQRDGNDYVLDMKSLGLFDAYIRGNVEKMKDGTYKLNVSMRSSDVLIETSLTYETRSIQTSSPTHIPSQDEEDSPSEPETQTYGERHIQLTEQEQQVANQSDSSFYRDHSGQIQSFQTKEEAANFAQRNGFRSDAAEDAFEMAKETNSRTTFATNASDITKAANDMLAHIKERINSNSEDLELVFVIDVSGSMQDDIKGVIDGLDEIVASLQPVERSGRRVKIGIVTFGHPGDETVQLQTTSDFQTVRNNLKYIYDNFDDIESSINPGEACYGGINCAAEEIHWTYKNRMSLVITDEPSWEVRTGRTQEVQNALSNLRRNAVQAGIYTIVTKN